MADLVGENIQSPIFVSNLLPETLNALIGRRGHRQSGNDCDVAFGIGVGLGNRVGEDIGFTGEVIRRLGKARQHVLEEQLEPLLRQRQAGRQRDDLVLHLRIESAEGPPGGLGNRAAAWR